MHIAALAEVSKHIAALAEGKYSYSSSSRG